MKIEAGKYYQNSKGLIRFVVGFGQEKSRWSSWQSVVYQPVCATGRLMPEKTCAESTMKGWAKREWDPNAAIFISPKRDEASRMLEHMTEALTGKYPRAFVDLVVEAAKEELRRELGMEAGPQLEAGESNEEESRI